jgi:hypothetical protein
MAQIEKQKMKVCGKKRHRVFRISKQDKERAVVLRYTGGNIANNLNQ